MGEHRGSVLPRQAPLRHVSMVLVSQDVEERRRYPKIGLPQPLFVGSSGATSSFSAYSSAMKASMLTARMVFRNTQAPHRVSKDRPGLRTSPDTPRLVAAAISSFSWSTAIWETDMARALCGRMGESVDRTAEGSFANAAQISRRRGLFCELTDAERNAAQSVDAVTSTPLQLVGMRSHAAEQRTASTSQAIMPKRNMVTQEASHRNADIWRRRYRAHVPRINQSLCAFDSLVREALSPIMLRTSEMETPNQLG